MPILLAGRRLGELVKLLDELEKASKDDDVTSCKQCRQYIDRLSSYVVPAPTNHDTTPSSGQMFVAILIKKILLLIVDQVCCWEETRGLEIQPLFAAIHLNNTHLIRTANVTLADVMDTIVLTRVNVICRRVEREGVRKWWQLMEKEKMWLKDIVTVVETQTDLLTGHGVSGAVRMIEGRIWKEVGGRLRVCDDLCGLLADLSTQGKRYLCHCVLLIHVAHSEYAFSAGYKCVWYLITARTAQQHTNTALIGKDTNVHVM